MDKKPLTVVEAQAQYAENVPYEGSLKRMRLALAALMILRVCRPTSTSAGGAALSYGQIDEEIRTLRRMIAIASKKSLTPVRPGYL